MRQPLFILALPRSYTSLIAGMLGQHPQAYGLPELNLFTVDRLIESSSMTECPTSSMQFCARKYMSCSVDTVVMRSIGHIESSAWTLALRNETLNGAKHPFSMPTRSSTFRFAVGL